MDIYIYIYIHIIYYIIYICDFLLHTFTRIARFRTGEAWLDFEGYENCDAFSIGLSVFGSSQKRFSTG